MIKLIPKLAVVTLRVQWLALRMQVRYGISIVFPIQRHLRGKINQTIG